VSHDATFSPAPTEYTSDLQRKFANTSNTNTMRVHNMHEFCKSEKSLVHEVPVATTSVSYHGQVTAEKFGLTRCNTCRNERWLKL
jgi:hypothetical protein